MRRQLQQVDPRGGGDARQWHCQLSGLSASFSGRRLGEPSRYPVGNGANWVEIVDVQ